MKRFKIFNTQTKKYEVLGYNRKTSWGRFPKEQIHRLGEHHEIHCFELIQTQILDLNGNIKS